TAVEMIAAFSGPIESIFPLTRRVPACRRNGSVTIQNFGYERSRQISGMKLLFDSGSILTKRSISTALVGLFVFLASLSHGSDQPRFQVNPDAGAGDVIVRGRL